MKRQFIIALIALIITSSYFRCLLDYVKTIYLTKHQKKLRKQGQTFKEWLLFTRYKKELPKWLLVLYYCIVILNLSVMIYFCFAWYIKPIQLVAKLIVNSVCIIDGILIGIFWILSWRPGDPYSHHEQWVPRPKKK